MKPCQEGSHLCRANLLLLEKMPHNGNSIGEGTRFCILMITQRELTIPCAERGLPLRDKETGEDRSGRTKQEISNELSVLPNREDQHVHEIRPVEGEGDNALSKLIRGR